MIEKVLSPEVLIGIILFSMVGLMEETTEGEVDVTQ